MEPNIKLILNELEEWMKCNNVVDYTIVEKIKFQEEYLGFIHFSTGRKGDRRKLLILDVRPLISQYSNRNWAYAVTTLSIGSGKKGRLTIWADKFESNPLNVYDVIYSDYIKKNNKGYWYLLNYHKI